MKKLDEGSKMKIIKPSWKIESEPRWNECLLKLELFARNCYKSEDKISEGSAENLLRKIIKRGHLGVLEHEIMTVRFICSRAIGNQITRHRHASFLQESTRYCRYKKNEIEFIEPLFLDYQKICYCYVGNDDLSEVWVVSMGDAEFDYQRMLEQGASPQQARGVLPLDLKTEIVETANLRQWLWIFKKRCAPDADPEIRRIMCPLRDHLVKTCPIIFKTCTDEET